MPAFFCVISSSARSRVVQLVAVFPAARFVEFLRAEADLVFEFELFYSLISVVGCFFVAFGLMA